MEAKFHFYIKQDIELKAGQLVTAIVDVETGLLEFEDAHYVGTKES